MLLGDCRGMFQAIADNSPLEGAMWSVCPEKAAVALFWWGGCEQGLKEMSLGLLSRGAGTIADGPDCCLTMLPVLGGTRPGVEADR